MGDNGAILQGYSRAIIASSTAHDLHLLVKPDADFEDIFKAWDTDGQEFVRVKGWLYTIDDEN